MHLSPDAQAFEQRKANRAFFTIAYVNPPCGNMDRVGFISDTLDIEADRTICAEQALDPEPRGRCQ